MEFSRPAPSAIDLQPEPGCVGVFYGKDLAPMEYRHVHLDELADLLEQNLASRD
jgi:hypothetical protein